MNMQENPRFLGMIESALTYLPAPLTLASGYTPVTFLFSDIFSASLVFALSWRPEPPTASNSLQRRSKPLFFRKQLVLFLPSNSPRPICHKLLKCDI